MSADGEKTNDIWSDVAFVENILKKWKNDGTIRVTNITSETATSGGDNYMSDLIRSNVHFSRDRGGQRTNEKKSLIYKIGPNTKDDKDHLAFKINAYEIEIEMMEKTLVMMNEILDEKNYRLSPRVLYTKIGDPSFIVMEDLTELGFRMADRLIGLDFEHNMSVMRGLAKFHATSVAIYEKDPSVIKSYNKSLCQDDQRTAELMAFFKSGLKNLSAEVVNWPELDSSYSEKLSNLAEGFFERAKECIKPREDELNVINHGDCWTNNVLFRYDEEGRVIDHIFLDFQICHWGSPAIDLTYFLASTPRNDVFFEHYELLIGEYARTLSETMSRVGCETRPPSLELLRKYLRDRELLAVISSPLNLSMVLMEPTEVVSMSDVLKSEQDFVKSGYKGARYREIMIERLRDWNSRGLLDS